ELEAEDDVEPVGHLVGIAPNQTWSNRVDPVDEGGFVDCAERVSEEGLQLRIEPAPEAATATDEVLPRPALRLMDGARGATPESPRRPSTIAISSSFKRSKTLTTSAVVIPSS